MSEEHTYWTERIREEPEKFGLRWVEADLEVSNGEGVGTIRGRRLVSRWEEVPKPESPFFYYQTTGGAQMCPNCQEVVPHRVEHWCP